MEKKLTSEKKFIIKERFEEHKKEFEERYNSRVAPKLTYNYLSEQMYLSLRSIKYYISGEKPIPQYHLEKLCEIIDCVPEWLTGELPEDEEHFASQIINDELNDEMRFDSEKEMYLRKYLSLSEYVEYPQKSDQSAGYPFEGTYALVNGVEFGLQEFEDYIREIREAIDYVTARYAYNTEAKKHYGYISLDMEENRMNSERLNRSLGKHAYKRQNMESKEA